MSYMVLARKWRPRNFAEMVGQEHVLRALINALDKDRLHHAFLFTGTRGVGKTTIARILARSLNCEQGVSSKPCGGCGSCREIDEGRFVDLIEVDAASRTGVDDTRELMENVQYAPTRGRYKVYIIDEVHMLSKSAFNALLKTLEEPPPHVKFLLATTDPQKIPVTVLSRCLQFNLKRLSLSMIQGRLEHILEAEDVPAEKDAILLLARAADGSLRDGLSLLDQAIAFGGGRVEEAGVREMLGTIQQESVLELLRLLAAGDASEVLAAVARLDERAPDYSDLLQELASMLQRIALAQVVAEPEDDDRGDREAVAELATRLDAEDVQLFYQIAIAGRRDLPLAPDPRAGFEMVLLRMLGFRPSQAPADAGGRGARQGPAQGPGPGPTAARSTEPAAGPSRAPAAAPEPATRAPSSELPADRTESPPAPAAPAAGESTHPWEPPADWGALVEALGLTGVAGQLAAHCIYRGRDGNRILLQLDEEQAHLETELARERMIEALSRHYGEELRLGIEVSAVSEDTPARKARRRQDDRQRAAESSILADPNVRALEEQFDASVRRDEVRPEDPDPAR